MVTVTMQGQEGHYNNPVTFSPRYLTYKNLDNFKDIVNADVGNMIFRTDRDNCTDRRYA